MDRTKRKYIPPTRIGLLFGSFNPIHIGHMALANYFLAFTEIEEVWFVVSPHNPFKNKKSLLHERKRWQLVNEAIGDVPGFKASDIEFNLPQPSYTTRTLAFLQEKYSDKKFALLMGADNLSSLHKWRNYQHILDNYKLYIYPRASNDGGQLKKHPSVIFSEAPQIEISSSFIRNAIKAGKEINFYMPTAAYNYMREMHFYEK